MTHKASMENNVAGLGVLLVIVRWEVITFRQQSLMLDWTAESSKECKSEGYVHRKHPFKSFRDRHMSLMTGVSSIAFFWVFHHRLHAVSTFASIPLDPSNPQSSLLVQGFSSFAVMLWVRPVAALQLTAGIPWRFWLETHCPGAQLQPWPIVTGHLSKYEIINDGLLNLLGYVW